MPYLFPAFYWFYSKNIWTKSSTNFYTKCTSNTSLFINIWKYCNCHSIFH